MEIIEAKKSIRKLISGYTEKVITTDDSGNETTIIEKHVPPDISIIISVLPNLSPVNWRKRLSIKATVKQK